MAMTLRKVLISDEVDDKCVEFLKKNGVNVVKNTKLSKEQLVQEIPAFDGLIVRSATKVTADVIAAASNLKIIGRAGTGVDNIDCNAATSKGIVVMNTPGGNTLSAAELTCSLILATSRHIAQGTESLKAGRWDRKKYMGCEVYGKTLAIVGLGRIGKEVALRMQSFGMTTIGFDPIIPASEAAEFNTEWLPIDDLWKRADYVTVHTPLIPQTKNLIGEDVFNKCKRGLRVINCARGGIVDEDALLRALEDGRCGGAGLDVYLEEPPKNRPLVEHPLVTCTPHLGASTTEAQSRVAVEIAEQFIDVVNGKSLFGAINAQALSHALSPETKPVVALGTALGKVAVALLGSVNAQAEISVATQGTNLKKAGSFLGAAALVGLLGNTTSDGLNLVSAPALAKSMGLKVATSHSDCSSTGYNEVVTLTVTLPGLPSLSLTGVNAGGQPMLIGVNEAVFSQGAVLRGHNIIYRSQANPQVLTAVIGALAGANSAVVGAAVSNEVKGENWAVVQVSSPVQDISVLNLNVNIAKQVSL